MKNNIFKRVSILAICCMVTINGCKEDSYVSLTPEFTLDAIFNPSSMKQVEEVLTGAYANLRDGNYYGSGSGTGGGAALMPDILSDNLWETLVSLANSRAMTEWSYNPSTGQVSTIYSSMYKPISTANIVLRDVDKFTTASNVKMANRIKGQALAIRALAHFDLMRYFANIYDRNSTTSLALNYSKEFTVSTDAKPARMTNKIYYDNLIADLTAAETLLSDVDVAINPTAGLTRPKLSLAAVHMIRARVSLYGGLWADAITAANKGIAIAPPLANTQAAFSGMYNGTSAGEMIWNVQFDAGQSGPTFLVFFATNNRSYFRPAREVATTTGTTGLIKTGDIRYNAYFSTVSGDLALTKYKGKGTLSDGNANFIAMRTGELYLIRAEAYARSSQELLAMADLNTLRANRITGYVPQALVGSALQDAIADERRAELFGEGHRFFDLKRTTRVITRGNTCGVASLGPTAICTLPATAKEWTFPIPETITKANPNIVLQIPGWN